MARRMKVHNSINHIRQQQPGQFRRPEDGQRPFTHVREEKLKSAKDKKGYSVYSNNEKLFTLKKDNSPLRNLFDYDAGLKLKTDNNIDAHREEKSEQQYDNTGKALSQDKQERLLDKFI